MKDRTVKVNEKFIYVGSRQDWYGEQVTVKDFHIFWCHPRGEKGFIKCLATIHVDIFETSCELSDLMPIS